MIDRSAPAHVLRGEIAALEAELAFALSRSTEPQQAQLVALLARLEQLKATAQGPSTPTQ